jgi:hypothetical protein
LEDSARTAYSSPNKGPGGRISPTFAKVMNFIDWCGANRYCHSRLRSPEAFAGLIERFFVPARDQWTRMSTKLHKGWVAPRHQRRPFWQGGVIFILVLFSAARLLAQPSFPTNSDGFLDSWSFYDTNGWTSDLGYAPVSFTNVGVSLLGNGTALVVDSPSPAGIEYFGIEPDGTTNITTDTATWMFWVMPDWSSASAGGSGPGVCGRLIEIGSYTSDASAGWFSLYLDDGGANICFSAQTNSGLGTDYLSAPITWTNNLWHFIVLEFSPSNSALFIDTVLAASGPGVTIMPPPDVVSNGFYLLSDATGELQAHSAMDDLATYNDELDTNTINETYGAFESAYLLNPLNPANWSSLAASSAASTPGQFAGVSGHHRRGRFTGDKHQPDGM